MRKYFLFFLLLLFACTDRTALTENVGGIPEELIEHCEDYTRNGTVVNLCATCGDGVCDPIEECTPDCQGQDCTIDGCGPLHCPQDC